MKSKKLKVKSCERGITLIALIITIVVMLILAGVTINLTLGENGIFTTAQQAAKNYTDAQNKELAELNNFSDLLNNTINGLGNPSTDTKVITLDGSWSQKNKVNMPKLVNTGLTPITINADGTYGTVDIQKEDWYSYDGITNKWANAQTKDGSMWVWIPRFAYKIDKTTQTIDVVFLQGTTDKYYDENGEIQTAQRATSADVAVDTTTEYTVHPAFTNESSINYANGGWDKEIPGFWMAKFEAGYAGNVGDPSSAIDSTVAYSTIYSYNGTNYADYIYNHYGTRAVGTAIKYPTFQANRASVNFIGIADAYDLCRSIQSATNVYGLSNIDSHMTKNSEWGAVAYLAHSKYGRNGEEVVLNNITINNTTESLYAVTGYGATATNASQVTTTWEKIQNGEQAGSWLTEQGQTASTTKNIYGIYDLSGGTWEWTAGYITTTGNYETYGGNLKGESSEYKTKYAYSGTGETQTDNYSVTENLNRIGEGIAETSTAGAGTTSWNTDYSIFPYTTYPFFTRGGGWYNGSHAGTFAFSRTYGYCSNTGGFRTVLVAQ